jgi:alanine racemase
LNNKTKLFAVVKSNAYGHGLVLFSKLADHFGVDGFCVDSVIEGRKLREVGIKKDILVLGPALPEFYYQIAAWKNITVTIFNFDALKTITRIKNPLLFHLKIDTGLNRQGFYLRELPSVLKKINNDKLKIKNRFRGAYTHFAVAKNLKNSKFTLTQIDQFEKARALISKSGFRNIVYHAAATGGTLLYPQSHFDLVRVGLGLCGYFPTADLKKQHRRILGRTITLKPVLAWRAIVSETKILPAGAFVGYDRTLRVKKKSKAVVVPVGYWHGLSRSLSNSGIALVKGGWAKILGLVSMDMVVLGLTREIKVKTGDYVTFIGKSGQRYIGADDLAKKANTVTYEILSRINPLIFRQVV